MIIHKIIIKIKSTIDIVRLFLPAHLFIIKYH